MKDQPETLGTLEITFEGTQEFDEGVYDINGMLIVFAISKGQCKIGIDAVYYDVERELFEHYYSVCKVQNDEIKRLKKPSHNFIDDALTEKFPKRKIVLPRRRLPWFHFVNQFLGIVLKITVVIMAIFIIRHLLYGPS